MKKIFWIGFLLIAPFYLIAADGFREFEFGDSYSTVQEKARRLCRLGELKQHKRWNWRSQAECKGYRFKENAIVQLFFTFVEDDLVQIYVVSKEIKDYLLLKHAEYNYLTPLNNLKKRSEYGSLADRLLLKDKVHQLGDEYRYTTFFYDNKWEWEYLYEQRGYQQAEKRRQDKLLEDESEKGLEGWAKFKFGETENQVKSTLEGMCSSIKVSSSSSGEELLQCQDYEFLDNKVDLRLFFADSGLVKIELKLSVDWYDILLPSLKKKYDEPYFELETNDYYFPSIEFPHVNVILSYQAENSSDSDVWVSLRYLKEGYQDSDQFQVEQKKGKPSKPKSRSKTEKILNTI